MLVWLGLNEDLKILIFEISWLTYCHLDPKIHGHTMGIYPNPIRLNIIWTASWIWILVQISEPGGLVKTSVTQVQSFCIDDGESIRNATKDQLAFTRHSTKLTIAWEDFTVSCLNIFAFPDGHCVRLGDHRFIHSCRDLAKRPNQS